MVLDARKARELAPPPNIALCMKGAAQMSVLGESAFHKQWVGPNSVVYPFLFFVRFQECVGTKIDVQRRNCET